ncbi:hypothetical protein SNF32_04120 [Enterococcus mundtii]|nr:hypothetical protein [Enterococcus mundtii]
MAFLIIISKRTIDHIEQETVFLEKYNQWPEIDPVIESYFQLFNIDRKTNPILSTFLSAFFWGGKSIMKWHQY